MAGNMPFPCLSSASTTCGKSAAVAVTRLKFDLPNQPKYKHRKRRQLPAQQNRALRAQENGGDIIADQWRAAEMFLLDDADLQSVTDGREAA